MRIFGKIATYASFLLLAACGGGGGSPGTAPGGGGGVAVANFDYQVSKNALVNSGLDEATLTITALDSKNNPVREAPVSVSVNSGIYTPQDVKTNDIGQVAGKISTGADKDNRNIVVNMTVGGINKTTVLAVTGSQLNVTSSPVTPAPGTPVSLAIRVADVNGTGIQGAPVKLAGTLGFSGSVITDAMGTATAQLPRAPAVPGSYTIEATASGVTVKRDITVVSASGGIPDAQGVISAVAFSITPTTIAPNVAGASSSRAALKAVFQDASNRAIQNVRVRFEIVPPGLGAGEYIFTGSDTVYTDVNGIAHSDYIAGTRSSPTNGVTVRACYGLTDSDLAGGACPNWRDATLTVAAEPLSITLGDNNKLERGAHELTYIKKFDVAVADSAGNAVQNARISASVDLLEYMKGLYEGPRIVCLNEDANRNGLLDEGEDLDGDGQLTPRKADVLISYVGSPVTGANGRATIQVEYPQNVATWLRYSVKVTTSVAGSEGVVEKRYVTEFIEGDEKNGAFLKPPYGFNGCATKG